MDKDIHIVLASTTSPKDTRLLDALLREYYRQTSLDIKIDVVAVGTGAALEIARRGDADMLLVHDPEAEERFVSEGYGIERREVMYNDFVVLGPSDDPAGIKNAGSAVNVFVAISGSGVAFLSRGDESGTHAREKKIWKMAGVDVKRLKDYMASGRGMADTLKMADEAKAYTLSDRGTYLLKKENFDNIVLLFEGDNILRNQYSIMAVNPERFPNVRYKEALDFIDFITGPAGQKLIGNFRDGHGNLLFHPNAGKVKTKKIA